MESDCPPGRTGSCTKQTWPTTTTTNWAWGSTATMPISIFYNQIIRFKISFPSWSEPFSTIRSWDLEISSPSWSKLSSPASDVPVQWLDVQRGHSNLSPSSKVPSNRRVCWHRLLFVSLFWNQQSKHFPGPHYCNEDLNIVYTVKIEDRRHLNSWDWIGVFRLPNLFFSKRSLQEHSILFLLL